MGWLVESALAGRWSRQGSVKATKKRRMYQLMRIFFMAWAALVKDI
jgi:hypothetical protein